MSLSLSLFLFPPLLPLYCLIWAVLPHWTLKKRHAYVRAIPPPKKPPTTRYATHAFKCILMEPNRRNAVVLLVTGKFTVKLQMESILWSSFTVVSGKWELCFHGHKLSNSFFFFTERKIPELPCAFEMFVVSLPQTFVTFHTTITGQRRVQSFSCTAFGKHTSTVWHILWFLSTGSFLIFPRRGKSYDKAALLIVRTIYITHQREKAQNEIPYDGKLEIKPALLKNLWFLRALRGNPFDSCSPITAGFEI